MANFYNKGFSTIEEIQNRISKKEYGKNQGSVDFVVGYNLKTGKIKVKDVRDKNSRFLAYLFWEPKVNNLSPLFISKGVAIYGDSKISKKTNYIYKLKSIVLETCRRSARMPYYTGNLRDRATRLISTGKENFAIIFDKNVAPYVDRLEYEIWRHIGFVEDIAYECAENIATYFGGKIIK